MYAQIVRKINGNGVAVDKSSKQSFDHFVEPSLIPQPNKLLPSFPVKGWSGHFSLHLAKRVRRNPRDLRAHVQRILFYISRRQSEAVYAALIDLFLILGNRGQHLRQNLLDQSMSMLKSEQYQFLLSRMESGLDSNEPLPLNTFSSLSKGYSGNRLIVRRNTTDPSNSDTTPFELATECIRQNDWFTALDILENALDHDPGDKDVCRLLLSLYKQYHAREAFYKTYSGLLGRSLALPELWRETESFFLDSSYDNPDSYLSN